MHFAMHGSSPVIQHLSSLASIVNVLYEVTVGQNNTRRDGYRHLNVAIIDRFKIWAASFSQNSRMNPKQPDPT